MIKKTSGFTLIEVIISIFLLSIISLGLVTSLLSLNKMVQRQTLYREMLSIAENLIESEIGGDTISTKNDKFIINYKITNLNEDFKHIEVKITSEETDDEILLQTYY
ncbi:MAG: prepilin-type N-terminal cleavage/methylation domain-containing protein [Tissierellia bacterium]|nr:prepilin-type N-terminal cleavage/methylation domain-containing protein [Tissierellia bacterium]